MQTSFPFDIPDSETLLKKQGYDLATPSTIKTCFWLLYALNVQGF
jgi:tRNA wybutosine-synthesizing protein 1